MRILDATHSDAGAYTCRARTSGGQTEATVHLSILEAPEVRIYPLEQFVAIGSTFNLNCSVNGKPRPEVSWYFKGKEIVADETFYISYKSKNNQTIFIPIIFRRINSEKCERRKYW